MKERITTEPADNREDINTVQPDKDNSVKDLKATADPAQADNDEKAAAVLKKFKDVQTLCKAYSDLEAEFTRRSQRLKELEKGNKEDLTPDGAESPLSQDGEKKLIDSALSNAKVREAVIGEYLKSVSASKSVPLVVGGSGISAPRREIKSVKEAGRLAQRFLD